MPANHASSIPPPQKMCQETVNAMIKRRKLGIRAGFRSMLVRTMITVYNSDQLVKFGCEKWTNTSVGMKTYGSCYYSKNDQHNNFTLWSSQRKMAPLTNMLTESKSIIGTSTIHKICFYQLYLASEISDVSRDCAQYTCVIRYSVHQERMRSPLRKGIMHKKSSTAHK